MCEQAIIAMQSALFLIYAAELSVVPLHAANVWQVTMITHPLATSKHPRAHACVSTSHLLLCRPPLVSLVSCSLSSRSLASSVHHWAAGRLTDLAAVAPSSRQHSWRLLAWGRCLLRPTTLGWLHGGMCLQL